MHHRVENTLATVTAIASRCLRTATSIQHAQLAIEGRLIALGRGSRSAASVSWASAGLVQHDPGAIDHESKEAARFSIDGPDLGITPNAAIALAMTLKQAVLHEPDEVWCAVGAGRTHPHRVVD